MIWLIWSFGECSGELQVQCVISLLSRRVFNSHHRASAPCGYGRYGDFEVQFQN